MDALAILIGFIALLLALNARKAVKALALQLAGHAARVREVEVELERLRRLRPDVPPPAPDAAPEVAPPAPPAAPRVETPQTAVPPSAEPPSVSAVPAHAPAGTSLEERLGTRWAVWVGGLALALGGLLLVRYSIEQGVFGPGVRVALGALFALALVAAGEWFRRTERAAAGRGDSRRARAEHPHRRRHGQRLRHRLCRACALRLHRSGRGLRPARPHRRRHHARRRAARAGAGGPRSRRLAGRAAARVVRRAQSVAARDLSRRGRRAPPMRWPGCAAGCGSRSAVVAGAFLWGLVLLGQVGQPRRRLGVGPVRAHSPAAGAGRRLHGARAASRHARRRRPCPTGSRRRRWRPCRCWPSSRSAGARFDAQWTLFAVAAMAILGADRLAQRASRCGRRACRHRRARRHRRLARPEGAAGAAPAGAGRRRGAAPARQRLDASSFSPPCRTLAIAALAALRLWRGRDAARHDGRRSMRWPPSCPRCWR